MSNESSQLAQIGAQLASARERRGLTQKDAALKIGVASNTLVSIELGRPVRATSLRKALDYYELQLEESPRRSEQAEMAAIFAANYVDRHQSANARYEALGRVVSSLQAHAFSSEGPGTESG